MKSSGINEYSNRNNDTINIKKKQNEAITITNNIIRLNKEKHDMKHTQKLCRISSTTLNRFIFVLLRDGNENAFYTSPYTHNHTHTRPRTYTQSHIYYILLQIDC